MSVKRFILIDGFKKGTHSGIWDNHKQNNQRVGDELWLGEVVDLLNELDGNWIGEFSLRETLQLELQRVENENEQLKLLSDAVREELGLANRDNTALEKKNEQLKQKNKKLADALTVYFQSKIKGDVE